MFVHKQIKFPESKSPNTTAADAATFPLYILRRGFHSVSKLLILMAKGEWGGLGELSGC